MLEEKHLSQYPLKQRITIRIDKEIIDFFKKDCKGRGYQTRINQALWQYIKNEGQDLKDVVRYAVREELNLLFNKDDHTKETND